MRNSLYIYALSFQQFPINTFNLLNILYHFVITLQMHSILMHRNIYLRKIEIKIITGLFFKPYYDAKQVKAF